jgi:EAL domain-containing protein (putative c-di-GMP-specific phosphodiesterase class I)/ActR/RegA family two-component response regulator
MEDTSKRVTGGGGIAYILDDEPEAREFIAYIVSNAGFAARSFAQPTTLEMALTEAVPQVIILDLSLGSSDGIDVMRSLVASRFSGSVLLISGRHDADTINEVHKIGSHHGLTMLPFLQKPFRVEALRERLRMLPAGDARAPREATLENALRNSQLELWYQPKIDLKLNQICGAEALIRLRHPERGILPPSAFLPRSGDPLHHPLADFVIRRALADWSSFSAQQIRTRLAINMPISIFETPEFVRNLRKYLPNDPSFPGLIVELTEDVVIRDPDLAHEIAIQLKLYNIGVAIDDYGSGHSTMEQAQMLPFAELKIDRSRVSGCSGSTEQYLGCRRIVELAHQLGCIAVAEGVEDAADLQALTEMKCDVAQGAIFAWPMPRDVFGQWFRERDGRILPSSQATFAYPS